jgi:hypothetical protein
MQEGVPPDQDTECLRHRVQLKVISGASGGGMTAAIAALALHEQHRPVTTIPGARPPETVVENNRLYDAWVRRIDIDPLLGTSDLEGASASEPVRSLLDSTILDDISGQIHQARPLKKRSFVGDPLHLLLTHTNLRGVPFDITLKQTAWATSVEALRSRSLCCGQHALVGRRRQQVARHRPHTRPALGAGSPVRPGHGRVARRSPRTTPCAGTRRLHRAMARPSGSGRRGRYALTGRGWPVVSTTSA